MDWSLRTVFVRVQRSTLPPVLELRPSLKVAWRKMVSSALVSYYSIRYSGRHKRFCVAGNMDEEEGVIDGGGSIDGRNDFVDVGLDTTLEGMSTTKELTRCKKTVLVFYLNFLKLVGQCSKC